MRIGTRSILFGAHQFIIHPIFVFMSWWILYGFPFDPRLWVAFIVHDLGYWQKPDMDGPVGETHVEFGAKLMGYLFDWKVDLDTWTVLDTPEKVWVIGPWAQLCLFHSRFYSKKYGKRFSRLCVADKLAFVLTPRILYLPLVRATGEIYEYMELARARTKEGEPKYASMKVSVNDESRWYNDVKEYLRRWVDTHKDGRVDNWTPTIKK